MPPRCVMCDYDLSGIVHAEEWVTCPECGEFQSPLAARPISRWHILVHFSAWCLPFLAIMTLDLGGADTRLWPVLLASAWVGAALSLWSLLKLRRARTQRGARAGGYGLLFAIWLAINFLPLLITTLLALLLASGLQGV